jgi:protein involved in plasmid replication-relaxation
VKGEGRSNPLRGAEILESLGELRRGGIRWDTKNRNLSRVSLHHTLAVAEVMVAFEVACREREGVSFIPPEEVLAGAPEETRRLRLPSRWQVEVRQGGKPYRLGVEPDRVFGLHFEGVPESRQRAYFFLEADRGTMPVMRKGLAQTSFARKLLAYWETWKQGFHSRHRRFLEAARGSSSSQMKVFGYGDILTHEWMNGRAEAVRLGAEAAPPLLSHGLRLRKSSSFKGPQLHPYSLEVYHRTRSSCILRYWQA